MKGLAAAKVVRAIGGGGPERATTGNYLATTTLVSVGMPLGDQSWSGPSKRAGVFRCWWLVCDQLQLDVSRSAFDKCGVTTSHCNPR